MTTETIQEHRTRRGAREVALAAIAERNAAMRAEALRRHERSGLTPRNVALGLRDAAREAWRLWTIPKGAVQGTPDGVPCHHCGLDKTPEGHDGCLGTLPGDVMNACCGHGVTAFAYIQYEPGDRRIAGVAALREQARLVAQGGPR